MLERKCYKLTQVGIAVRMRKDIKIQTNIHYDMLRCIALSMTVGALIPCESSGSPYIIDSVFNWANIRQAVIQSQGENKSILDIGCGNGFSTSSSHGSLGIDTNLEMLSKAMKLFPEKKFEFGDVLFWKPRNKYDVVTSMFYLHEHPRHIRKKIIELALKTAKERVIFVDLSPDYCHCPSEEPCKRKPHLKDYLQQCREELQGFDERVIVKGRINMWVRKIR